MIYYTIYYSLEYNQINYKFYFQTSRTKKFSRVTCEKFIESWAIDTKKQQNIYIQNYLLTLSADIFPAPWLPQLWEQNQI